MVIFFPVFRICAGRIPALNCASLCVCVYAFPNSNAITRHRANLHALVWLVHKGLIATHCFFSRECVRSYCNISVLNFVGTFVFRIDVELLAALMT